MCFDYSYLNFLVEKKDETFYLMQNIFVCPQTCLDGAFKTMPVLFLAEMLTMITCCCCLAGNIYQIHLSLMC